MYSGMSGVPAAGWNRKWYWYWLTFTSCSMLLDSTRDQFADVKFESVSRLLARLGCPEGLVGSSCRQYVDRTVSRSFWEIWWSPRASTLCTSFSVGMANDCPGSAAGAITSVFG